MIIYFVKFILKLALLFTFIFTSKTVYFFSIILYYICVQQIKKNKLKSSGAFILEVSLKQKI